MRASAVWPEINLDRSTHAPTLRRQIEQQLASAIRNGALPSGARLPSSRVMAKLLGVSRGTVVDAYESLLAAGLLAASAGSAIRIARSATRVPNLTNLARTVKAAHYPVRVCRVDDPDGTALYLNAVPEQGSELC